MYEYVFFLIMHKSASNREEEESVQRKRIVYVTVHF